MEASVSGMTGRPKDQTERLAPSPVTSFEDETVVSDAHDLGIRSSDTFADEETSFDVEDFDAKSIEDVFDEMSLAELEIEVEVPDEVTKPRALPPRRRPATSGRPSSRRQPTTQKNPAAQETPGARTEPAQGGGAKPKGRVDPWGSTQIARRTGPFKPIGGAAPTRLLDLPDEETETNPAGANGPGSAGRGGAPQAQEPSATAPVLAPPQELERTLAELSVLLKYGHEAQVRQLVERLRRAYPEDMHLHDRLVDFHLAHEQPEEAVSACFAVARVCFEQRKIPGFAAALERVLCIEPDNPRAKKLLRLIRNRG